MNAASDNQASYLRALLAERDWRGVEQIAGHVQRGAKLLEEAHLDADGASWMINQLQRCRRLPMPDGRYFAGGRRFRTTTATEGQWAGFTSVREQDARSGSWSGFLKGPARKEALRLIREVGWAAAAVEYGRRTSHCGFCGQELRDPTSVASGVGPDCRVKHGIAAKSPATPSIA